MSNKVWATDCKHPAMPTSPLTTLDNLFRDIATRNTEQANIMSLDLVEGTGLSTEAMREVWEYVKRKGVEEDEMAVEVEVEQELDLELSWKTIDYLVGRWTSFVGKCGVNDLDDIGQYLAEGTVADDHEAGIQLVRAEDGQRNKNAVNPLAAFVNTPHIWFSPQNKLLIYISATEPMITFDHRKTRSTPTIGKVNHGDWTILSDDLPLADAANIVKTLLTPILSTVHAKHIAHLRTQAKQPNPTRYLARDAQAYATVFKQIIDGEVTVKAASTSFDIITSIFRQTCDKAVGVQAGFNVDDIDLSDRVLTRGCVEKLIMLDYLHQGTSSKVTAVAFSDLEDVRQALDDELKAAKVACGMNLTLHQRLKPSQEHKLLAWCNAIPHALGDLWEQLSTAEQDFLHKLNDPAINRNDVMTRLKITPMAYIDFEESVDPRQSDAPSLYDHLVEAMGLKIPEGVVIHGFEETARIAERLPIKGRKTSANVKKNLLNNAFSGVFKRKLTLFVFSLPFEHGYGHSFPDGDNADDVKPEPPQRWCPILGIYGKGETSMQDYMADPNVNAFWILPQEADLRRPGKMFVAEARGMIILTDGSPKRIFEVDAVARIFANWREFLSLENNGEHDALYINEDPRLVRICYPPGNVGMNGYLSIAIAHHIADMDKKLGNNLKYFSANRQQHLFLVARARRLTLLLNALKTPSIPRYPLSQLTRYEDLWTNKLENVNTKVAKKMFAYTDLRETGPEANANNPNDSDPYIPAVHHF